MKVSVTAIAQALRQKHWTLDYRNQAWEHRAIDIADGAAKITEERNPGTKARNFVGVYYTGNPARYWMSQDFNDLKGAVNYVNQHLEDAIKAYNGDLEGSQRAASMAVRVASRFRSKEAAERFGGYGREHNPAADGPPAHDLVEDGNFLEGSDVLTHPEHYTGFRSLLPSFWNSVLKAQGKPSARLTLYRAVPPSVDGINRGDWVTLSLSYAKQHLRSNGEEGWGILRAEVPASTLRFAGDDLMEFGYWGPTVKGKIV